MYHEQDRLKRELNRLRMRVYRESKMSEEIFQINYCHLTTGQMYHEQDRLKRELNRLRMRVYRESKMSESQEEKVRL